MLVLHNKTGPTEMSVISFREKENERQIQSHCLANQKKAGVPECKPDDLFIEHSRTEESSTLIYHKKEISIKTKT